ncbi:MAG: VOC family protein [Luteimonas sp.]
MILLVNIDVPDIPAAVVFYTAAFGLHAARCFGDDGVELLGASVPIYPLRKPPGSVGAATSPRDYDRHWSSVHCDVVVDDIDRALARAISAGAVQEGDVRNAVWGRIVQLADPFGHGWCLLQFLGRGYDEIAT